MLSAFWEGLGAKLSEQWLSRLLSPALLFWATGTVAWCWSERPAAARRGGVIADLGSAIEFRAKAFEEQSGVEQIAWIVGGLLVVAASALVVERFTSPILRILEGYWPHNRPRWLWNALARGARRRRARDRAEWGALRRAAEPSSHDLSRLGQLESRLHHSPPDELTMPTALGNILRAGEMRPLRRYGLDSVVVWPRLWLLLPDAVREEVVRTRRELDRGAATLISLSATAFWSIFVWWLWLLILPLALVVYRASLLPAARVHSDVVEAVFDLHRRALYEALGAEPPPSLVQERAWGERVTGFLWRGIISQPPMPDGSTAGDAQETLPAVEASDWRAGRETR